MAGENKTYVQTQEEKQSALGNAAGAGAVDKEMLNIGETNRLLDSPIQAICLQSLELTHDALVAIENKVPLYIEQLDKKTQQMVPVLVVKDSWKWLLDFTCGIQAKQLTMGGYSRVQHLGVAMANAASLQQAQNEKKGLFGKLFG